MEFQKKKMICLAWMLKRLSELGTLFNILTKLILKVILVNYLLNT